MFLRVQNEAKKEVGKPIAVKPVANDGAFVSKTKPKTDGPGPVYQRPTGSPPVTPSSR